MAQAIVNALSGNIKSVAPGWLDQFTIDACSQEYLKALGITSAQASCSSEPPLSY